MAKRKRIPTKLRRQVFERDNFTCVYCGARASETPLEIDHVIPVSMGGTNNINNLVTACRHCNRAKYNYPPKPEVIQKLNEVFIKNSAYQDKTEIQNSIPSMAYWGSLVDNAEKAAENGKNLEIIIGLVNTALEILESATHKYSTGTIS